MLEGIVQGYIVDAFGEIRAEENDRENDSGNNCLVCSLSKFELQRHGAEFEAHVDRHHNRWCVPPLVSTWLLSFVPLLHSLDILLYRLCCFYYSN